MDIRPARLQDLADITRIYGDAVNSGTASFEYTAPDLTDMAIRWAKLAGGGFPYLVAEIEGIVAGYAYAGPYHTRPGYRATLENSVYVAEQFQGRGIGSALLGALIEAAETGGFRQMIAVIGGTDNVGSIRLHARHGFEHAGILRNVGYKHERWIDVVIMQRALGDADTTPPACR